MSKFKKSCLLGAASATTIVCTLITADTANASGYQLREVSGTLQGSSFAGMSTSSADASTTVSTVANSTSMSILRVADLQVGR